MLDLLGHKRMKNGRRDDTSILGKISDKNKKLIRKGKHREWCITTDGFEQLASRHKKIGKLYNKALEENKLKK